MRVGPAIFLSSLILISSVGQVEASTITCPTTGTFDRQATLTNVVSCAYMGPVSGTPQEADVEGIFGGDWFNAASIAGANGSTGPLSNGFLSIAITSGSWGAIPVAGTWGIDPTFWTLYPRAVLTFHLGNGAGNPDWFFFEVTPSAVAGTFDIRKLSGGGGGFSNVFLWADPVCEGDCTPPTVPEPGSLLLLGTGLAGLAVALRRRARS